VNRVGALFLRYITFNSIKDSYLLSASSPQPYIHSPIQRALMALLPSKQSPLFHRQSKEPYRAQGQGPFVQGSFAIKKALYSIASQKSPEVHRVGALFLRYITFNSIKDSYLSSASSQEPYLHSPIQRTLMALLPSQEPYIQPPVERALKGTGLGPFCTGLFCHQKSPIFNRLSKEP